MGKKSKAEQVLEDNKSAMDDLMVKIRSDPNYIVQLYKDCPGMRRVLDEHPDLKKIFENPDIMRKSFEAVYVKNGGEPEPTPDDDDSSYESDTDEDDYESSYGGSHRGKSSYNDGKSLATEDFDDDDTLAREKKALKKKRAAEKAATDPSKAAQVLSKLAGARGVVIIAMSFMSPFKIVRKLGEVFFEGDIEPPLGDASAAADACNAAAEHFDDPAVAEEMDRMLEENPENLEEIVENDEALRNLRDSDPIAAELMKDPETFKVITDGDNLRAMGELTQAMEGDFAGGLEGGDAAATAMDAADATADVADTADAADGADAFDADEPDLDEEGEDYDDEEEEDAYVEDAMQDEMEDRAEDGKKSGRRGQRGRGKNQNQNRAGDAAKGAGGLFAAVGMGVAGGVLGDAMGDFIPDFGGGAEDLAGAAGEDLGGEGFEDLGGDAELLDAADAAEAAGEAADEGLSPEELGVMAAAGGAVVATGAVGGAYVMTRDGKKDKEGGEDGTRTRGQQGDDDEEEEEEGEGKKKGMFGKLKSGIGNVTTFVADTAKETLITNVLGDDVGEAMLDAEEDLQESEEESEEDDDSQDDDKNDRRKDRQQQQQQQRNSSRYDSRYEDDYDDNDWNYERGSRKNSWR